MKEFMNNLAKYAGIILFHVLVFGWWKKLGEIGIIIIITCILIILIWLIITFICEREEK